MIVVGDKADEADDWIAERIGPGDVCVTADIPLAHRCLGRGAQALSHAGHVWTGDNIGSALAGREVARHLREIGAGGGRPGADDQGGPLALPFGAGHAGPEGRRSALAVCVRAGCSGKTMA